MNSIPPPVPGSAFAPVPPGFPSQPAGQYALYSPQAVVIATFLGSPLAGTAIMALNYKRLGRWAAAFSAMACGVIATAVSIGLAFALPSRAPGFLVALLPVVVMAALARSLQGEVFNRHQLAGGKVASMWKAAGIGLLSGAAVLGIIVVVVVAAEPAGGTLKVGNSEIIYSGAATKADADALGKALTDEGYFGGSKATTVLLSKDASGATVQFVVNEEAGQKDSTLITFTAIAEDIAPAIGGKPITLKLVNPELKELKSKVLERPAPVTGPGPTTVPVVPANLGHHLPALSRLQAG